MQLRDILSGALNQSDPLTRAELRKKQLEEKMNAVPAAWGPDRVSISAEAREAVQTAGKSSEKASTEVDAKAKNAEEGKDGLGAEEEFATYMKKSRSRAQNVEPEEELKALQDKLKSLQSQLVKISTSDTPDASKSAMVENLNAQITSIMEKIAEVSARAASKKTKDAGGTGS